MNQSYHHGISEQTRCNYNDMFNSDEIEKFDE